MISMIPARTRSELLDVNRVFYNALWADTSRLNFAGDSLLALDAPVDVRRRSRVIASASEVHSPDYNGHWHDSVELEDARLVPERARP